MLINLLQAYDENRIFVQLNQHLCESVVKNFTNLMIYNNYHYISFFITLDCVWN